MPTQVLHQRLPAILPRLPVVRTEGEAVNDEQTKRCPRCGEVKSRNDFPRDKYKSDGLASKCTMCDRAQAADYYQRNRDLVLARQHARYWRNETMRLRAELATDTGP